MSRRGLDARHAVIPASPVTCRNGRGSRDDLLCSGLVQHNVLRIVKVNFACVPPKSDNLNVRLDPELRGALERIRDREGPDVTLADLVSRALREFVARESGTPGT